MKMVKSLLLGSAAGIVAVAGAQAADLPVKAKPVEYVKVCSIYGAGFFYIPGTDTCVKVGGFVRADYAINGSANGNPNIQGALARDTREDTQYYGTRVRGIVSWDARSQTEWGTLRAYIRAGWELNNTDLSYRGTTYFDRAFIQFAGLTVGKTQSFFDFYANALNYNTSWVNGSDTGHGINLIAYTAQFAGGFSATISLEEGNQRRNGMLDATCNNPAFGCAGTPPQFGAVAIPGGAAAGNAIAIGSTGAAPNYGNYVAQRYPDIVANLRVDQPWGSAQIAGALHDASGSCVGATCFVPQFPAVAGAIPGAGTSAGDATGYAISAGVMFNLPWAQGDQFWAQGTWTRGATNYIGQNAYTVNTAPSMIRTGGAAPGAIGSAGLAWAYEGIFDGTGSVSLVDAWQINAAIQHYWTPNLRTSVFAGIASVDYDASATAKFCAGLSLAAPAAGAAVGAGLASASPATFACNPDYKIFQVGARTIWSPVRNLDIGVEVLYSRLDQNHEGNWNLGANGSRPAGLYTARDQDTWNGLIRFQRNFNP